MSQQFVLSREQVRSIDRMAIEEYGIPGVILMENAGRSCADLLLAQGVCPSSPVVICCGKGNNGGDGFVMARHLEFHGIPVEILIFSAASQLVGDANTNYQIAKRSGVPIHFLKMPHDEAQLFKHLSHASWVVDALLGTGSAGEVRDPYKTVIKNINRSGKPVFAIDVPSGLDCDLGKLGNVYVQATITATLVAEKPGFRAPAALKSTGEVHVVQIGIPQALLTTICGDPALEEHSSSERLD